MAEREDKRRRREERETPGHVRSLVSHNKKFSQIAFACVTTTSNPPCPSERRISAREAVE